MPLGTPHARTPLRVVPDEAVSVVLGCGRLSQRPLRAAFERAGLSVVAESATARDAVSAMVRADARACVLDAALPGDRAWAIGAIRAAVPGAVIVLFAREASDEEVAEALSAGANGYLTGPAAAREAATAVELALAGHAVVPAATLAVLSRRGRGPVAQALVAAGEHVTARERQVLEALGEGATTAQIADDLGLSAVTVRRHVSGVRRKLGEQSIPPAAGADRSTLTTRELQVLELAAAGLSNQAIADELFISPSTVKNHFTRLMGKLGARNRTEAAVLAARHGHL